MVMARLTYKCSEINGESRRKMRTNFAAKSKAICLDLSRSDSFALSGDGIMNDGCHWTGRKHSIQIRKFTTPFLNVTKIRIKLKYHRSTLNFDINKQLALLK